MATKKTKLLRVQVYVPPHIQVEFRRLSEKFYRTESDLGRILIENFVKQQQAKERAQRDGK